MCPEAHVLFFTVSYQNIAWVGAMNMYVRLQIAYSWNNVVSKEFCDLVWQPNSWLSFGMRFVCSRALQMFGKPILFD